MSNIKEKKERKREYNKNYRNKLKNKQELKEVKEVKEVEEVKEVKDVKEVEEEEKITLSKSEFYALIKHMKENDIYDNDEEVKEIKEVKEEKDNFFFQIAKTTGTTIFNQVVAIAVPVTMGLAITNLSNFGSKQSVNTSTQSNTQQQQFIGTLY